MDSRNRLALRATLHCLSGCSIGEVGGMVAGAAFGLSAGATVAISIVLAFFFGYLLTLWPLRAAGIPWRRAMGLAAASDTVSITIMEIVDNVVMLVIPGAMTSGPGTALFWISMAVSLVLAGAAAFPVNRWLIARGQGHAVVHDVHGGQGHHH
ncbi:MAG TPA: DUF4396 domain-containing protein [Candidatus Binatia bacterium]|nr:DUF4396 domain-containing protein [Candidatus Binatia bacterium]